MGPIWGRQDPGGPHVGPMNHAIWGVLYSTVLFTPQVFQKPMKQSEVVTKEDLQRIFVNWKELIMCNTKFLKYVWNILTIKFSWESARKK